MHNFQHNIKIDARNQKYAHAQEIQSMTGTGAEEASKLFILTMINIFKDYREKENIWRKKYGNNFAPGDTNRDTIDLQNKRPAQRLLS